MTRSNRPPARRVPLVCAQCGTAYGDAPPHEGFPEIERLGLCHGCKSAWTARAANTDTTTNTQETMR